MVLFIVEFLLEVRIILGSPVNKESVVFGQFIYIILKPLKYCILFIRNSNLAANPAFLFAKPGNPISIDCIMLTFCVKSFYKKT